jgi:antitoxin component of RelBE/YafQ-DinJ toxin-antitoxin module
MEKPVILRSAHNIDILRPLCYKLRTSMQTTIHIKTDSKTADAAKQVAEDFGITLSTLVNQMLEQVGRTKKVNLDLDETPSLWLIEALRQSDEDEKAGCVMSFNTPDDAVKYVQSLIDHDKGKSTAGH